MILTLVCVTGCTKKNDITKSLEHLVHASPYLDVLDSIEREDYKFIGRNQDKLIIPYANKCLLDEFGYRFIRGTSHNSSSYAQRQLNALAEVYSENYNMHLLEYISKRKLPACSGIKK